MWQCVEWSDEGKSEGAVKKQHVKNSRNTEIPFSVANPVSLGQVTRLGWSGMGADRAAKGV